MGSAGNEGVGDVGGVVGRGVMVGGAEDAGEGGSGREEEGVAVLIVLLFTLGGGLPTSGAPTGLLGGGRGGVEMSFEGGRITSSPSAPEGTLVCAFM